MMKEQLATYIHQMDPFAIQFSETFGLRWYGLAYVAGFVAAFFLLRWFVKLGACELRRDQVADFISIVAVLGVMIGGRLGYMLLYDFARFSENPLIFLNFLGGGMASHGGFAGVVVACWFYARYTKKSWIGLGDNLVTVAPVGIFFGRIANFVNGELYGRPSDGPFAMKFPDELTDRSVFSIDQLMDLANRGSEVVPGLYQRANEAVTYAASQNLLPNGFVAQLLKETSWENPVFREILGSVLTPRHPSQLYEALTEGLLLFVILLAVRLRWKNLYHGILTGLFFVLYPIGRIIVENYREPDSTMIGALTKGQFYSVFMIVMGIGFFIYAFVAKRRNELPPGS